MDVPDLPEIDPNFEPQTRARSNTWPALRQEIKKETCEPVSVTLTDENGENNKDLLGLNKKTSSRRNAWGNLSYADLITKAIQSSPEQRLTLSQIYDWMVQNVPYFKDKGDSNSSAGWKNSIRHNLSLHNRFMRIQNEGTGKSSWWVLNPDAKPGKTPRRRALSMDTKTYEKKRGRAKKKVEAMRAAMEGNSSPTSTISENGDILPESTLHGFQLSPDFRPRTSSNASSCGRLSPIQSALEPDLHDNQVPSMSPIPWSQELGSQSNLKVSYSSSQDQYTDQLTDSLADIVKLADSTVIDDGGPLGDGIMNPTVSSCSSSPNPQQQQQQQMLQNNSSMGQFNSSNSSFNSGNGGSFNLQNYNQSSEFNNTYSRLPPPPPYPDQIMNMTSQLQSQIVNQMGSGGTISNLVNSMPQNISGQLMNSLTNHLGSNMAGNQVGPQMNTLDMGSPNINSPNMGSPNMGSPNMGSPNMGSPNMQQQNMDTMDSIQRQQQQQSHMVSQSNQYQLPNQDSYTTFSPMSAPQHIQQTIIRNQLHARCNMTLISGPPDSSILRNALTQKRQNQELPHYTTLQPMSGQQQPLVSSTTNVPQAFPQDLDFNLEAFEGFDCDVDQVIKHELNVDGSLDCNFDTIGSMPNTAKKLVH